MGGVEHRHRHHRAGSPDRRRQVVGNQRQADESQSGDYRRREIEEQELPRSVHRFQRHAEPVQKQHVEEDVPDAGPIVAERVRQQPPDLSAENLAGLQLEPFLNQGHSYPSRHIGRFQRLVLFVAAVD